MIQYIYIIYVCISYLGLSLLHLYAAFNSLTIYTIIVENLHKSAIVETNCLKYVYIYIYIHAKIRYARRPTISPPFKNLHTKCWKISKLFIYGICLI